MIQVQAREVCYLLGVAELPLQCGPARSKWRGELCESFALASRSSALHCLYDAEILHGGSSCPQDDGKRGRRKARTIGGRSIPRPRDQRVEDNAFHLIGPKS